jgi:inner membrane protein
MLINLATNYGWWILALALIGAEMLVPGYFMLWIGIAGGMVGALLLLFPDLSPGTQALLFFTFAMISCFIYWKFVRPLMDSSSEQPLLNRRGEQLIGKRYVLATPIINGHGKARVGDSLWLVEGADLPSGTAVEVVAVDGTTLKVRAG